MSIFIEFVQEILASRWELIYCAWIFPVRLNIRINKVMRDQVLYPILFKGSIPKINNPVSNQHPNHINFLLWFGTWVCVMAINPIGQIWNVFTSIRFTCKPELVFWVFRVISEEKLECIEVVFHCSLVIVGKVCVFINWVPNSSWRFDKKKMRNFVPWIWILF